MSERRNMMAGAKGYSGRKLSNMEAFDKLPKAVREALRNADHNWSAAQLYENRRKRPECCNAAAMIETLREHDRRMHVEAAEQGLVCPGQR